MRSLYSLPILQGLFFSIILSLFSQINVDIGLPVPLTGQTFILLIGASLMPSKTFTLGILLYFIAGIGGVPVFAESSFGWNTFTGPSLGYFLGFLVSGITVSHLIGKYKLRTKILPLFTLHFLAHIVILLLGFIFLLRYLPAASALQDGAMPFILPSLIKSALSSLAVCVFCQIISKSKVAI